MPPTPMDELLKRVKWNCIPAGRYSSEIWSDNLPVATHEGRLEFAGWSFRVYRLSDGQRVIHADDLRAFVASLDPESAR